MSEAEKETTIQLASQWIASRQTVLPKRLVAPGPDAAELEQLFRAAADAPDHDLINPWRFLIIPEHRRADLGALFAQALLERDASASNDQVAQARDKALRAPLLMLLIVDEAKGDADIDLNERVLSAGCAVQNFMLLAHAMGYGSGLTSGKALKADSFRAGLGLGASEHAICCLSVGTVSSRKPFKPRPEVSQFTRIW
ncbi:nitroreductase [Limnohabitans sp. 2KL-1]|jgi:nitroreductase|uniref:nitroreductase family protein n=1 Tax=Limnohabitans sp. 2KL-1 TaxID=1100699 RepID=UPI000D399913|nr:nitroreductase [Limnohabitans sp. 2KL-1]PUE48922.1 nitroreductase [Limnohabitans sp. 2KL-1]